MATPGVQIAAQGWGELLSPNGDVRGGAYFTIVDLNDNPVILYSDAALTTEYAGDYETQEDGSLPGYVASGIYKLTIAGKTYRVEAVAGTLPSSIVSESSTQQVILPNPISSNFAPIDLAIQGDYIYWSDVHSHNIGRCKLDGTGATKNFCVTGAAAIWSVAVDENYIYWTDTTGQCIGRANLDGSGADNGFFTGLASGSHYFVRVDENYLYWSVYAGSADSPIGTIGRANLDGSDPNPDFVTGCVAPHAFAVNATHIYWTEDHGYSHTSKTLNGGMIARANIDGTGADHSFIDGSTTDGPTGIALDDEYVYWVDYGWWGPDTRYRPRIGRAKLDGTEVNPQYVVRAADQGSWGLARAGNMIYWTIDTPLIIVGVRVDTPPMPTLTDVDQVLDSIPNVPNAITAALADYVPTAFGKNFAVQVLPGTAYAGTSLTIAAKALYMMPVSIPWNVTLNGLVCALGAYSSGNVLYGIYDSEGTLLAWTDAQAAAAVTIYRFVNDRHVTTPVDLRSGLYYLAMMFDGTAPKPNYGFCLTACHGTTTAPVQDEFVLPSSVAPPTQFSQFVPNVMTW